MLSTEEELTSEKLEKHKQEEERQRLAAKQARKKARNAAKRACREREQQERAREEEEERRLWAALPHNERKAIECMRRYPWVHLSEAHFAALNAENDQGAKDQRKTAYVFMCIKRAREQGITVLDYLLGRTQEGDYVDIDAGFYIRRKDAEFILAQ